MASRFPLFVSFFVAFLIFPIAAQEIQEPPPTNVGGKSLERLQALTPLLLAAEEELEALRKTLIASATEEETREISAALDAKRLSVAMLRDNFRTLATGVEESEYLDEGKKAVSLQENLEDIIEPLSRGVREMTTQPREMEALKNELSLWQDRTALSTAALTRLDKLLRNSKSPSIMKELAETRELWDRRHNEADSQIQVLRQQIEERELSSPTTWEAISGMVAEFWRSRGLNLLIALGSALFVFWLTRKVYRFIQRHSPIHKKGKPGLFVRAADLLVAGLAIMFALLTVVLAFYLQGDWLLLTLAVIAVVGILWASKQAVPPYLEQLRTILNIGPVRMGERVIFNGIPWKVTRLNFYCEFRNPVLTGGFLRLAVRDVMKMYSREPAEKEVWFPTHEDDWVVLKDETYGKVIRQTPEQVVVLRLGGSMKVYQTGEYLAQAPESLSHGFRVQTMFGVDYKHQKVCLSEVLPSFQKALELRLLETVERENLRSVKVEFASAAASSLDYVVLADFSGDVAMRKNFLERLIQRVCVEVCNEHGWEIPFTQVTVIGRRRCWMKRWQMLRKMRRKRKSRR